MFTGLVQSTGQIQSFLNGRLILSPDTRWESYVLGESIAVNGVCLTLIDHANGQLTFDVGPETILRTTFSDIQSGEQVNLERALRVGEPLGGHMVQGHVDTTGEIIRVEAKEDTAEFTFHVPSEYSHLLVDKGSICLDGISLTLIQPESSRFRVMIIPHTRAVTTAHNWEVGTRVNVEFDVIAKHVAKLMEGYRL